MSVEAVTLVLGENEYPSIAAVDETGKSEVDEPVLAAKGNRRLGAVPGQRHQSRSGPTGENHRENSGAACCHDNQTYSIGRQVSDRQAVETTPSSDKMTP